MTYQEIPYPDDVQQDMDKMRELKEGKIHSYSIEKRYLKPDGIGNNLNNSSSPDYLRTCRKSIIQLFSKDT